MAMDSKNRYFYDILEKKIVSDCNLYPAETSKKDFPCLYAENNKYTRDSYDPDKMGSWIIISPKDRVNETWDKIKVAVTNGDLWRCIVSTFNPKEPEEMHTIVICTKNYADLDDIVCVLDFLESSEIKPPNVILKYEPEEDTRAFAKPWLYSSDTIRTMASSYIYKFDIIKNEVVTDCKIYPTEVFNIPSSLTAKNNKYADKNIDPKKVGKWIFLVPKDSANATWDKIKMAVTNGELWRSKVTTSDPEKPKISHTILVYTKDYTDIDDVICTLDYLEISGIKPLNENIKYEQTNIGITKRKKIRSWIYSSNLIRSKRGAIHSHYRFDIFKKEIVVDSKIYPTEALKSDFSWLLASNNKFINEESEKGGNWILFVPKDNVNAIWDKVKMAITNGELWCSRVSTTDPESPDAAYTLQISTKDQTDLGDVIQALDYLEKSGIKPSDEIIMYLTDLQAARKDRKNNRWLYTSDTVRSLSSICYTYEFDIRKSEVVRDCNLYPTDFCKIPPWLEAQNNKYTDESIDDEKVGDWMIFSHKDSIDTMWDKIKMAVRGGELWRCSVSTVDPKQFKDFHLIMIATKDYADVNDVIQVLDVLERLGIKPPEKNIKYVRGEKTMEEARIVARAGRSWVYSSNLIRSVGGSLSDTYEFDIYKNELVKDCKLYPAETLKSDFEWLNAENNKYPAETIEPEKIGQWTLISKKDKVNAVWDKIKIAVTNGELWRSRVTTSDPKVASHFIMVYTKDHTDVNDVISVLDFLEISGIKSQDQNVKYLVEEQTKIGGANSGIEKGPVYTSNLIRSKGGSISKIYEFDLHKKEIVTDCKIYPTEALKSDFEWIHARNNKYTLDSLDFDKVGKWMIFLKKDKINPVWDQIKMAVTTGDLWSSKVSTTDPLRPDETYAIMIYTKDYTDKDDVIHVLNYLESSGIKPPNVTLTYKNDLLTYAGIYSGGREKSWIYSSDMIRSGRFISDTYEFDLVKKEMVSECDLNPTEVNGRPPWLYARNNKYPNEFINPEKVGKWMLFLPEDSVNTAWDKIKTAVTKGELWSNKLSTFKKKNYPVGDSHTVMIYTKDSTDKEDVIQVLDYLESSGIKPRNADIKYRTDDIIKDQTGFRADRTSGPKPWLYSANTIRPRGLTQRTNNSIPDTFEYDIRGKVVVTDCTLNPTQVPGSPSWLYAKNNKYPKEIIDPRKIGKWTLFLREDSVNATWDRIKTAIASGELWSAKVSTFRQKNYPIGDSYTVMIFTKDRTDLEDIIYVLDFLESSRIKPVNANITYRPDGERHTGHRSGSQKPLYLSNTVRNEFNMDKPWR